MHNSNILAKLSGLHIETMHNHILNYSEKGTDVWVLHAYMCMRMCVCAPICIGVWKPEVCLGCHSPGAVILRVFFFCLFFSRLILLFDVDVCESVHVCRCPQRPRPSDPQELVLQVLESHLAWVLGTKRAPPPTRQYVLLSTWPSFQPWPGVLKKGFSWSELRSEHCAASAVEWVISPTCETV